MGITIGDAILWIRVDDSKLDGDLNKTKAKTQGWLGSVGGFFKDAFSFATGGLIVQGVNAITGSIGGLAKDMISGNAEFERYNVQFTTLLGSAEASKERLADLAEFGAKTPFELPEVVKADKILQGFGLHSTEAAQQFGYAGADIRTIAGDVAAGTGSSFEEMSLLIGKFSAGATGEALARMAELGIGSKAELTKLGLQFDKSGSLLSPLPQAMNTVLTLMKDKYGGLMDAQSKTFEGMMSNLSDWWGQTKRQIGEPIFNVVRENLGRLLEFLGSPAVQGAMDAVANGLTNVTQFLVGFVEFLAGSQEPLGDWSSWWESLAALIGGDAAQAVIDGLSAMRDGFNSFIAEASVIFNTLRETIMEVIGSPEIKALGEALVELFQTIFGSMGNLGGTGDSMKKWSSTIQTVIKAAGVVFTKVLIPAITQVVEFVRDAFPVVQRTVETVFRAIMAVWNSVLKPVLEFIIEEAGRVVEWVQDNWPLIQRTIEVVMRAIQLVVQTVLKAITDFWQAHGEQIMTIARTVWETIKTIIDTTIRVIAGIIKAVMQIITGDWRGAWETIQGIAQTVWNAIRTLIANALTVIQAVIQSAMNAIQALISSVWNAIVAATQAAWNAVLSAIQSILSAIASAITSGFAAIQATIQSVWNAIVSITQTAWSNMQNLVSAALSALASLITSVFATIRSTIENAWNGIAALTSSVWQTIYDTVNTFVNNVLTTITTVFANIVTAIAAAWSTASTDTSTWWSTILASVGTALTNLGASILSSFESFKTTISDAWTNVNTTTSTLWNAIRSTIDSIIGVDDTSGIRALFKTLRSAAESVWDGLDNIVTGIWDGIRNGVKSGVNAVIDVLNALIRAYNVFLRAIGQSEVPEIPHAQAGLNMVVPPGFENDTFPILASSGERVQITPPGRSSAPVAKTSVAAKPATTINIYGGLSLYGVQDAPGLLAQLAALQA